MFLACYVFLRKYLLSLSFKVTDPRTWKLLGKRKGFKGSALTHVKARVSLIPYEYEEDELGNCLKIVFNLIT